MKDVKIVIGANAGDEGKGLMTDYFSQKPNSIVVCSNGGSQRGHTVTTPDGIRHVFHHFGSGTLNGAASYLPKEFIVNPLIFNQEYEELMNKGVVPIVYAHSDCMVSTPYDMMANHIVEENRGKQKHGSCGLGIFETIKRYESDITDFDKVKDYYLEKFEKEGIVLSDSWKKLFNDKGIYEHFLEDLDFMNDHKNVYVYTENDTVFILPKDQDKPVKICYEDPNRRIVANNDGSITIEDTVSLEWLANHIVDNDFIEDQELNYNRGEIIRCISTWCADNVEVNLKISLALLDSEIHRMEDGAA